MSAPITAQRDFLRVGDLAHQALREVLDLAIRTKSDPAFGRGVFAGETIACYFAQPSTRTRVSFEAAAARLGLAPVLLRPDELQLGRGETIADVAKVISAFSQAIVVRTSAQYELLEIAEGATVPVINALTDLHNPCQALADLLTLEEHFGALAGLKLAYIGDAGSIANSLMEAAALTGIDMVLATPVERRPDHDLQLEAEVTARAHGCAIALTDDPREAVQGADAVYTAPVAPFRVTSQLMRLASDDAVFMHCLPMHRGEEVESAVIDGPQSIVFEQSANRMPTEQAILFDLIARRLEAQAQ